MITGCKISSIPRQSSYNSLYDNPLLKDHHHNRSSSEGGGGTLSLQPLASKNDNIKQNPVLSNDNKENEMPNNKHETAFSCDDKENVAVLANGSASFGIGTPKSLTNLKSLSTGCKALKPSSLQFCMQMNEPEKVFGGPKMWDPSESDNSSYLKIWEFSDSEAAPASSWSTLPNKSLMCRPLPLDIGRCTCVIVKEASSEGFNGGTLYSLYTNAIDSWAKGLFKSFIRLRPMQPIYEREEGRGRQDRKLAVASYKRRNGKSEFTIAQIVRGLSSSSDDNFLGTVTANLMGSKYHIWDQGTGSKSLNKESKSLIAIVAFLPTITTWTGSYRSLRAYVPKHQSMQLKNTNTQVQHIKGLPKDWEVKKDKVHQLFSRVPQYNKISRQYELDFRDSGRAGLRIQSSVKNFQLTLEKSGKQTILQLGRVGKSKYVMDYRYPLTGYQAFCISLASIDSKLCCSV
ncbi:Tubby, C-terminal [Parasponia andersonii]|uniref:Tubby, C-terminal n=1 Tax=Parasponia andersonii TaxID=3476 RepID=A0A2P5BVG3_PARAD|nr:Tubby, C-terminal [Parasponia andersonii]